MSDRLYSRPQFLIAVVAIGLLTGLLAVPVTRNIVAKALGSLRMQKVQAVNVDLSPFTDPNANPALHQMVAQMISDKVVVTVNENDQPAADSATATRLAGFPVQLLSARKDSPTLVVGGQHALNMSVDRARLQEIVKAAGHPEIALPASLDSATVSVQIPHAVHAQYGTCPQPATATGAIANQVIDTPPSATQYADCVRLSEGPSPTVNVPAGLDVTRLAEIGLEVAGMTPSQADNFFHTVDWKSTLTLTVPRQLRSYQQVKVDGVQGVLLTMAGRRGPGYNLIWAKNGIAYALTGYGDSGQAVELAGSLK
jgi:hypothetical protein